jgi:hypothetical protein
VLFLAIYKIFCIWGGCIVSLYYINVREFMDDPQDKTISSDQRAANIEQDIVSSEQEEVISEQRSEIIDQDADGVGQGAGSRGQDREQRSETIDQDAGGAGQAAEVAVAEPIALIPPIPPIEPVTQQQPEQPAEPVTPVPPISPISPNASQEPAPAQPEVPLAAGVQMVGGDVVPAGAEAAEDAGAAKVANAHNESTVKDLVTKVIGPDGNIDPAKAIGVEKEIMSQRAEAQKGQAAQ